MLFFLVFGTTLRIKYNTIRMLMTHPTIRKLKVSLRQTPAYESHISQIMSLRGQSVLRRNGKQQSCEPCRKSKLKCDHVLPRCGRCIQRKIEYRCVYHPAPMSKHTLGGDTEAEIADSEHSSLVSRVSVDWIGPNVHTHRPLADAAKLAGDQPVGYLGPTS